MMKKFVAILSVLAVSCAPLFAGNSDLFLSLEKEGVPSDFITQSEVTPKDAANKNTPVAFDLVSSMPGIFVSKAASQIKSDINIRGLGDSARELAVFIDGRPEKMSVFGCSVAQTVLSGNVDSIEVVKGPDSVLYGSGAMGGTINIITKKPQKPFEAGLDISYGSYNTQNYFADVGGRQDKFSYYASANKASSDGYIDNSGYDTVDYSAKFSCRTDAESEISVDGKYFDGYEQEPMAKTTAGAPVPASRYDYKRGGADLRYKRNFENVKSDILFFGDFGEHLFFDSFHSKDSTLGVFAHFSSDFFEEKNILKYGAEYKYSDGKVISGGMPYRLGEWDKNEFAVFALDEHAFGLKTKAFAGMRYNHDEISGDFFAPRAGLSYAFTEKISAKAEYSRGFRTPQLNELYTLQSSNPDLKPEEVNNYEIGLNSKYFGADIDLNAYVMNGDNIIQPTSGKFQNSGSYVFKGIEAGTGAYLVKDLKAYAGYTFLDSGDLTQGRPGNKFDASLDYKIGKFDFYAGAMFLSEYYGANNRQNKLDDINVFNAKIHYNITESVALYAAADNFTDQKYQMLMVSNGQAFIYDMPGATYTLGIKITV